MAPSLYSSGTYKPVCGPNPSSTDKAVERIATADSIQLGQLSSVPVQDWIGPDDPDNPQNWALFQRVYHTTIPSLYAFTVTFGLSAYNAAVPEIMQRFQVSSTVAVLGLSLYILGLAFGPVLAAPISESKGRKVVYLASFPCSALFTLGAGSSKNFTSLAVCRFFAGLFGAPALAVGVGTNVDVWKPVHYAVSISLFLLASLLGAAIGPVAGGFLAQYKGWRWTQWIVLILMIPVYLYSLPMKETYKKSILRTRARRLRLSSPDDNVLTMFANCKASLSSSLITPVHMLLTEPIVFFFSLYDGFAFSVLFGFFVAFPIVFQDVYAFSIGSTGLTFIAGGLGFVLAAATIVVIDQCWYQRRASKNHREGRQATVAPECRLFVANMGSFALPLGIFVFAWTSKANIHWIVPVLATILFGWGFLGIFISTALYLVDVYGSLNGASALAANCLFRYSIGAAIPLFTKQMYSKIGIPWATSVFALTSLALLPIPWILFNFGRRIRAKSKY